MRELFDIESWDRKEHYLFFKDFVEPYHGVNVHIECGKAYDFVKEHQCSFFLFYLHCALQASNAIANFKLRIENNEVYSYDVINAGSTVGRDNGTFGFGYFHYKPEFFEFATAGTQVIKTVKSRNDLQREEGFDLIRCSAIPWIDFSSLSHARQFSFPDSCPKLSFGKMTGTSQQRKMPIAVHVHHALVDGLHLAQFLDAFQTAMNLEKL